MTNQLATIIDTAWDNRTDISAATKGETRDAVNEALNLLDSGAARVAQRGDDGQWQVNQWLKKAVLLSFRLNDNVVVDGGSENADHLIAVSRVRAVALGHAHAAQPDG